LSRGEGAGEREGGFGRRGGGGGEKQGVGGGLMGSVRKTHNSSRENRVPMHK